MATSKKLLVEQAMRRIKAGNPSAGSNAHPAEVEKALEGVINGHLRPRFFETMQFGESIPEGCVIVSYSGVPVTPYQGVSQCFLPAIPASLPKNMGVWHIAPTETVPDELAAPAITFSLITAFSITVLIGSVKGAVSYVVQQSLNGTNWQTIGANATTYLQTGLTPATKYYFRAMAIGNGRDYTNSGWRNADTVTTVALAAATLTATAVSSTEIDLTWNAVANRTSYLLERSTNGTTWITIYSGTATAFNDTGRTASTQYFYRHTVIGDGITYSNSSFATANATTQDASLVPTANLWAWYKADAGVSNPAGVQGWADQSGNGRDLAYNNSTPSYATGIINGLPVVRNNGNGWLRTSANFPDTASSGLTIYLVAAQRQVGVGTDNYGTFFSVGVFDIGMVRSANLNTLIAKGHGGTSSISNAIADDTFYTLRLRCNSSNEYLAINNAAESFNALDTSSYTAAVLNLFKLGDGTSGGRKDIAELLIYTENHDPTKRDQVETYLKTKYNHY